MRSIDGTINALVRTFIAIVVVSLLLLPASNTTAQDQQGKSQRDLHLQIPSSLKTEHAEIQSQLAIALKAGGDTERAAKKVAKLLHEHFLKEEDYAFPLLALLPGVTDSKDIPHRNEIVRQSERFQRELPQMLEEHKTIVEALRSLADAARKENKAEQLHFVEKLKLHAQTEEQILYPAALLVGAYLKCGAKDG